MNCGGPNDELCTPPDVCANVDESREKHLIAQHTNDHDSRITKAMKRDKPLLISICALVVCLNLPFLRYALYPFMIFSTWIHEMSHGMMAILVGGGIQKLLIYKDGSGLAWTYTSGETWKRAFVASAGYTGTALLGGFLLLWRRTRRGPTIGCMVVACAMLLSTALYIRNTFGAIVIPITGVAIAICAWKLKQKSVGYLYSFLAATCSFNAIESIRDLFGGTGYVNGEPRDSDAHSVAEYWGMTYTFWASWWLVFALIMSAIGLFFAIDGITYKEGQKQTNQEKQVTQDYYSGEQGSLPVAVAIY